LPDLLSDFVCHPRITRKQILLALLALCIGHVSCRPAPEPVDNPALCSLPEPTEQGRGASHPARRFLLFAPRARDLQPGNVIRKSPFADFPRMALECRRWILPFASQSAAGDDSGFNMLSAGASPTPEDSSKSSEI
jgi:hypothetical protein